MRQVALAAILGVMAARPGFSQTVDPVVLVSCAATSVTGWTNPGDCAQPLSTADNGWSKTDAPLTSPSQYFEQRFSAPAGTYHVWVRMRALNDSKWNDSVWLQFSDALDANGQPIYAIGSTTGLLVNLATDATATSVRGWGWQDGAYWLSQTTTIKYATSGPHTIRVQVREDGVSVDEIVVSSSRFATAAPGGPTNDSNHFVAGSSVPPSGDARSLATRR